MKKINVSVIVPTYNVRKYIKECLDSILNQTLKNIEIICGDGGSTDGTLEILKEYEKKDNRIKVIYKKGSGYGQSVNECIQNANGEYIGIVESDDAIEKNMYKELYSIAKEKKLDWIRGDIYYYFSQGKDDKRLVKESIIYENDYYNTILNPQVDYRPYDSLLRTWAGIYKKNFLEENNIKHNETNGGAYQDVGFYLKTLYYAKKVYFLNKAYYMWRQDNPNSTIHYDSKRLVEKSLKEWELNKQFLITNKNATKMMWYGFNYKRYYSYLWTLERTNKNDKKRLEKYIKKEIKEAIKNDQISKEFFLPSEWKKMTEYVECSIYRKIKKLFKK